MLSFFFFFRFADLAAYSALSERTEISWYDLLVISLTPKRYHQTSIHGLMNRNRIVSRGSLYTCMAHKCVIINMVKCFCKEAFNSFGRNLQCQSISVPFHHVIISKELFISITPSRIFFFLFFFKLTSNRDCKWSGAVVVSTPWLSTYSGTAHIHQFSLTMSSFNDRSFTVFERIHKKLWAVSTLHCHERTQMLRVSKKPLRAPWAKPPRLSFGSN